MGAVVGGDFWQAAVRSAVARQIRNNRVVITLKFIILRRGARRVRWPKWLQSGGHGIKIISANGIAQGAAWAATSWLCKFPAVKTNPEEMGRPASSSASATQVLQVRNRLKLRLAG